ncbi:MAG: hypothetical protein WCG87_10565 [Bacteroidota bacterium]
MNLKKWLRIAFLNILIVAAIGIVLRYKIAYSLTFIDQKHLLHGHSHFAFCGWITQALMALIVARLSTYRGLDLFKRYNILLFANLICAYGMLLSFPVQGYGAISITFSTASLIVSYVFAVYVWKDIKHCSGDIIVFSWFKAATLFNALSSLGALGLAFMMISKIANENWYLAAVYFFLHFQYNGWFCFAILGLLFEKLAELKVQSSTLRNIFRLFFVACIPAYFLSALWMPMPTWVYVLVVWAAILQVWAWGWATMLLMKKSKTIKAQISPIAFTIVKLSLLAFTIKLLLQLASTIPSLSTLTFGFRPIVVGYLHLVLLGFTSLFILGYTIHTGSIENNRRHRVGISIFISGIILNEIALMIQGITAMKYVVVPYINEILLLIAIIMFSGLLLINIPNSKN